MDEERFAAALREELDRRIAELATHDESSFGRLGAADWTLISLLCVALPLAIVWWSR